MCCSTPVSKEMLPADDMGLIVSTVKIIILHVNARPNLLIVLGFTLLLVRVHLMKRRNVGAGGHTDFVSGPVLEQNELVAIHDLAMVGWPNCR